MAGFFSGQQLASVPVVDGGECGGGTGGGGDVEGNTCGNLDFCCNRDRSNMPTQQAPLDICTMPPCTNDPCTDPSCEPFID